MIYQLWSAGARDAAEGRTVFSRPGGGTRVGEKLSALPLTLRSDPDAPGLESRAVRARPRLRATTPRCSTTACRSRPTDWIRDGALDRLTTTRHSGGADRAAGRAGRSTTWCWTAAATRSLEEMVARDTGRGLLLTCLWYIREVDPATLLLTGLTRDGVYLVEDGEVVGAVNNFRFNESPVDLLGRADGGGPHRADAAARVERLVHPGRDARAADPGLQHELGQPGRLTSPRLTGQHDLPDASPRRHRTVTDIVDELKWRGLFALSTDEDALRKALADGPVTFYCGFDPTAPSLHVGHLVQVLTMRRLQQAGHRPLALVGGATGQIGDPRPTAERTLNDPETVANWVTRLRSQIEPFLSFEGENAAVMVNNLDWTAGHVGDRVPARTSASTSGSTRCSTKDSVARRLESDEGISYTEFSYQLLQGMDFLELYRRYGCTLQQGGSDQWGNLTAGTRPDPPPGAGRRGARAGDAADDQGGRHQVRQDRERRRLARPGDDDAVRVLPVLAERGRPGHLHRTCASFSFRSPRGAGGAGDGRPRSVRRPVPRSGRWPRS